MKAGGGDDQRGENVIGGDREARLSQCAGDRCPGPGCRVGDQGQRERGRCSASTAPGSGFREMVSTPSMSISTARMRRMRRPSPQSPRQPRASGRCRQPGGAPPSAQLVKRPVHGLLRTEKQKLGGCLVYQTAEGTFRAGAGRIDQEAGHRIVAGFAADTRSRRADGEYPQFNASWRTGTCARACGASDTSPARTTASIIKTRVHPPGSSSAAS